MKTFRLCRCHSSVLCNLLIFSSFLLTNPIVAQVGHPVINSIEIQGTNLVINVDVPEGVQRVTLESRTRLDAQSWVPIAVSQWDGQSRRVRFIVPQRARLEVLRVRANFQQPLPQRFYTGKTSFEGPPTNTFVVPSGYNDSVTAGPEDGRDSGQRAVVESDIWRIDGDRLYFFNQYRGLQILDISEPDNAHVMGTLPIPAAGEQMYLADSNHVVLLARSGCYYGESEVLAVGVTNGDPQLLKSFPIQGYIQESRMVGTALYVASQMYRPINNTTNSTWEWGSLISSFDLSNPASPVSIDELWFPGYGHVISATDTFLFLVTQDPTEWRQSLVRIIDITAPDGTMAEYASVSTAGQVLDKFKLNYSDGVFTSIAEDWRSGTLVTRLETFRLPDPRTVPPVKIQKLGSLELGERERLHATRFDGEKVYVVTFFQIDPLWVVDLSDPTQPRIAGALEIPGWSTYIKPLGPRLVSVGVETNRVAVSLFDVSDPSRPGLLSRVVLGQNYSWSEANYDEKAFSVLEDANLILVPYNGDTTNGWTSRVQLIDLLEDKLVARGMIEHTFQPRRATYTHDRVLSLSGTALLTVDVDNRDEPKVTAETTLAWAVDRIFVKDDFLIQIGNGTDWWSSSENASLSISAKAEPQSLLNALDLGDFSVVGATVEGDRLYVAQARNQWFYPPEEPDTNAPNFLMTVVDVSDLPNVSILGQTTNRVGDLQYWWGGGWQQVWPKPGILVWSGGGGGWWYWGLLDGPFGRDGLWWPGTYSSGGHLLCFDVTSATLPKLVSEVNLQTNSWWNFSGPFVSGTLVYLSHTTSAQEDDDPTSGWLQRSFLDVVDYEDPANPTLRKPVNIPSSLIGLSHSGELLYTKGIHWTTNQTDWREWLDASAYDGIAAHLVDSLALPDTWPHPVLVSGEAVLIGKSIYDSSGNGSSTNYIETWTLDQNGEFKQASSLKVPYLVSNLIKRGNLLVAQDYSNNLQLFDATDPFNLNPVGQFTTPGCIWFGLEPAEGSLPEGLWIPLGLYGVLHVPVAEL